MENIGLKYLKENPLNNVLLISRYFDSEVIYESKDGCILKDGDAYYISFRNKEVAEPILKKLKLRNYFTVNKFVNDIYSKNGRVFYQYHYISDKKIEYGNYDIRKLDITHFEEVYKVYNLLSEEDMKKHLEDGDVYGIFEDNKLAGFIGEHTEESIGMLNILEKYRGKGYAYALEGFMINKTLDERRPIYCHVLIDNKASITLQNKIGLYKEETYVYWVFD